MKRKKQFIANFLVAAYLFFPALVFAQTKIGDVLEDVQNIVEAVIPIIFGLAFIVFLWGMYQYIGAASEGLKEEGRNKIIYGLIGLFVMVAVWGLVKVVGDTFEIDETATFPQPGFPGDTP